MSNVQGLFSTTLANPSGYPGQSFFGQNNVRVFMRSGTFVVPPGVSTIRVRVHGAGGSGAVATASTQNRCATGGGGGGFTMKVISTTPGTSYAVTVGAGGTRAQTLANGVAGGTSSFGAILTATGGAGGLFASANAANSAAGAAGGTGSGGDVNYTGGSSGSGTTTSYTASQKTFAVTGGGACGSIYGNGGNSGSVSTVATTTTGTIVVMSGGGGVGGSSGNVTYTGTGGGGFFIVSGSGGTAGGSVSYSTSTNPGGNLTSLNAGPGFMNYASSGNETGVSSFSASYYGGIPLETYSAIHRFNTYVPATTVTVPKSSPYPLNSLNRFPGDILMAGGTTAQDQEDNGGNPSPGAGMGSRFNTSNQYVAGPLGGGGAAADPNNNGSYGGGATVGGGGGGVASFGSTDANAFSGYGGDGMVIVEW
jgi:hypothetical protein